MFTYLLRGKIDSISKNATLFSNSLPCHTTDLLDTQPLSK